MLVQEMEKKMENQQARFAEEQAERQSYLRQCAQQRTMRQERQQRNLIRLINARLERGEEIVQESRDKKVRGVQAKERQSNQFVEAGDRLQKSIEQHRHRVTELECERRDGTLRNHYRRWNHRRLGAAY